MLGFWPNSSHNLELELVPELSHAWFASRSFGLGLTQMNRPSRARLDSTLSSSRARLAKTRAEAGLSCHPYPWLDVSSQIEYNNFTLIFQANFMKFL